jgi:hypothetical protein
MEVISHTLLPSSTYISISGWRNGAEVVETFVRDSSVSF